MNELNELLARLRDFAQLERDLAEAKSAIETLQHANSEWKRRASLWMERAKAHGWRSVGGDAFMLTDYDLGYSDPSEE